MPATNYLYSIPKEYYDKYSARKYGFHGTSHRYVSERAAELLGKPIEETKIITATLVMAVLLLLLKVENQLIHLWASRR